MDSQTFQAIAGLVAALIGSGGILAWRKQRRQSHAGMPADEAEARQIAPAAELFNVQMTEIENLRKESRARLAQVESRVAWLESEREIDQEFIDNLEEHIWKQLPPPPPKRRRQPRKDAG